MHFVIQSIIKTIMSFDLVLFNAINGMAGQWRVLDILGIFLAHYLPYVLIVILLSFCLTSGFKQKWGMVLVAFISAGTASLIVKRIILFFIQRPRPYMVLSQSHTLISKAVSENFQAFPSGHALFFFALAMAVYFYHKKWGIFFFIWAGLMGLARIFTGVHWPSDILGGAILGVAIACLIQFLYVKYFQWKNQPTP